MPEVWHEGGVQVQPFPPLNVDQSEGCSANGEVGQRGELGLLQLWQSPHWRDQAEAGNQAEGTPSGRNVGKVSNPVTISW